MGTRFFCNKSEPVVETKQGKLRGFFFDGVYNFWGVKYAKAKRFQMPEPVEKWEGVKNAIAYGYICPILNKPTPGDEIAVPHRFWTENESCQNLNIWTNSLDSHAKKPVMVWFHGGGFSSGSAIEHVSYEGDNLARYEDVVTVCVNHRLNAFGHLDMSSFGEKYYNSINVGIADLVEALRWIRDNITAFGGDPNNVTIFGQSGGGGKVTALGQCPEAAGLFHKAIIMSGIMAPWDEEKHVNHRELVLEILTQLKLTDADVEELEKVPTHVFIRAVNRACRKFEKEGLRINWGPKANDWYLGYPLTEGFTEYYQKVPTLIGTVFGEFYYEGASEDKSKMTIEQREQIVIDKFGEENGRKFLNLFKRAYPYTNEAHACAIDTLARPETLKYIREKAKLSSAPVYSYLFALEFEHDGGRIAWHCADIPFAFHNADKIPYCHVDGVMERMERQFCGAFTNFAKTGDPNMEELPKWDACTAERITTMVFDKNCEAKVNYEDELLAFAEKLIPPKHFDFTTLEEDDEDGNRPWLY